MNLIQILPRIAMLRSSDRGFAKSIYELGFFNFPIVKQWMRGILSSRSILNKHWPLGAILGLSFVLNLPYLHKPFIGHHDWNSVVYATVARNYLRYGPVTTRLGQVNVPDVVSPENFGYITHYPPLLPLTITLSFKIFGVTEFAARLVPLISTLILIAAIYSIGSILFTRRVGILAGFFATLSPMLRYFSLIPVHETVVPAWATLTVFAYIRWQQSGKSSWTYACFILLTIGGLYNWSAYYITPFLVFHALFFNRQKRKKLFAAVMIGICITLFAAHFLHIWLLTEKSPLVNFTAIFLDRVVTSRTDDIYGYTHLRYLAQLVSYFKIYYSLPVVMLGLLWSFRHILLFGKHAYAASYLWLLAGYGMMQLVVFRQLSFIHDYMIVYATAFVCLSAASSWTHLVRPVPRLPQLLLTIGLLLWLTVSTQPFLDALLKSDMNRRGFWVGKFIHNLTRSGERTLITSDSYKEFQDVFIVYYADRYVTYSTSLPQDFDDQYRLVVIPKDHAALIQPDKDFLAKRYLGQEDERFTWYDLTKPRQKQVEKL